MLNFLGPQADEGSVVAPVHAPLPVLSTVLTNKTKTIAFKSKEKQYLPFLRNISTESQCMPLRVCQKVDPSTLCLFLHRSNTSQNRQFLSWMNLNCCSCQADRCSSRLSRRLGRGPHNYQCPFPCQSLLKCIKSQSCLKCQMVKCRFSWLPCIAIGCWRKHRLQCHSRDSNK